MKIILIGVFLVDDLARDNFEREELLEVLIEDQGGPNKS